MGVALAHGSTTRHVGVVQRGGVQGHFRLPVNMVGPSPLEQE